MFEDLRSLVAYLKQKGEVIGVEEAVSVRHDIAAPIPLVAEKTGAASC
jgi:3-polyprenyl-4-hydroxybenzoate decarboxylase